MPYRISRLGHVEIRSVDLDRDLEYYVNVLGLHVTGREGRTAYLKGWDERHAYSFCLYDLEILRSKWYKNILEQSLTSREQKEKIPWCTHAPGSSPCYPSRVCRRRLPKGWPSFGVFFVAKKALSMLAAMSPGSS